MGTSTVTFHMVNYVNTDNKVFMHDIAHYSNMIDINKKGEGVDCPFCLSKIALFLYSSFRMQTSSELIS